MMARRMRLDKLLAHSGYGTRSEIKRLIKQGAVTVNGVSAKDGGQQIVPERDEIAVAGERVEFREFVYLMMNKPKGVVSATEDARDRTVIDLLGETYAHYDLFPVGRLDKDTEGLLLLTNDGKLAHRLLSPRKHVPKTYYAEVAGGPVGDADAAAFERGVVLDDGYVTMPAKLVVRSAGGPGVGDPARIELTIMEGKFHQVKRMFAAVGKKVVYLKRIAMGPLSLDERLFPGQYRELSGEELERLKALSTP